MDEAPNACISLVDGESPLLLIDLSYFVFFRYFALLAYFKKSEREFEFDDFIERFDRLFQTNLLKLCKNLKFDHANTILVGDCARAKIWRMEDLETYKSNRDNKQKIHPGVFEIIYKHIIPRMERKFGIRYVSVDGAEADDVIGWIHRNTPNTTKVIVTNDNDYLQLADQNTTLLNLKMKNIVDRGTGNPQEDLLYKILVGDVSDNITGVVPPKKAQALVKMAEEEMHEVLRKDKLYDKFLCNKRLIDMRSIPDSIQEAISFKVKICSRSSTESR